MPYAALPARRMPYDIDGTVVGQCFPGQTITSYPSQAGLQGYQSDVLSPYGPTNPNNGTTRTVLFFPESREVAAVFTVAIGGQAAPVFVQGSNNTTNALDGTWETASLTPSGGTTWTETDSWRNALVTVSFAGTPSTLDVQSNTQTGLGSLGDRTGQIQMLHVYGAKTSGQTPNDVIFIDVDDTGTEFTAPEDFGDRPLGTTVVRSFAIQNTSTLGAHTITLQLDDTDFALGTTSSGPWVQSIDPPDLAAGAQSATYFIKNTTPAAGSATLGPRFARCIVQVGSYS